MNANINNSRSSSGRGIRSILCLAVSLCTATFTQAQDSAADLAGKLPLLKGAETLAGNCFVSYTNELHAGTGLAEYHRRANQIHQMLGEKISETPYQKTMAGDLLKHQTFEHQVNGPSFWVKIANLPTAFTAPQSLFTEVYGEENGLFYFYRADQDMISVSVDSVLPPETLYLEYLTKFISMPNAIPRVTDSLADYLKAPPAAFPTSRSIQTLDNATILTDRTKIKVNGEEAEMKRVFRFENGDQGLQLVSYSMENRYLATGAVQKQLEVDFQDYKLTDTGIPFPTKVIAKTYASLPEGEEKTMLLHPSRNPKLTNYHLFTTTMKLTKADLLREPGKSFIETFAKDGTSIVDFQTGEEFTYGVRPAKGNAN